MKQLSRERLSTEQNRNLKKDRESEKVRERKREDSSHSSDNWHDKLTCLLHEFCTKLKVWLYICLKGITGDDFFALGVRNRRIVHKFNLGSGVATIFSDPLNQRIKIHTVHFGRYLRNGWMKVLSLFLIY